MSSLYDQWVSISNNVNLNHGTGQWGWCFHTALLCYIMLRKITPQPSLITEITTSTTGLEISCNLNASNFHSKWGNWIPLPLFQTALKSLGTVLETILKPTSTFTIPSGTCYVHVQTKAQVLRNWFNRKPILWESLFASIILFVNVSHITPLDQLCLNQNKKWSQNSILNTCNHNTSKMYKADTVTDHIDLQTN
jgi:hypothetical protein